MLGLLADLGADVEWQGENEVRVHAADISKTEVDEELSDRIRGSFLLAGPLLARYGHVLLSPPGGDFIGRRPLDTHVHAFQQLGAEVSVGRRFELRAERLVGRRIFLDEASVMGTENAVMAATFAEGETVLDQRRVRAARPGPLPLPRLARRPDRRDRLERAADRRRRRSSQAARTGSAPSTSRRPASSASPPLPAVTSRSRTSSPTTSSRSWRRSSGSGSRSRWGRASVRVPPGQELVIRDDLGDQIPKIEDGPWPAFPADLTSIALAVATQATGTILIFEKMFENRLFFVDKLVRMGARIILCDPHRAVVSGPAQLHGERLESPDIRAGMAMLIAALCAEGTSVIGNIGQIDRGYERIDERLRALGASIERLGS